MMASMGRSSCWDDAWGWERQRRKAQLQVGKQPNDGCRLKIDGAFGFRLSRRRALHRMPKDYVRRVLGTVIEAYGGAARHPCSKIMRNPHLFLYSNSVRE